MRIVVQFGSQLVLARILGPEVFGVFAVAALALLLASLFSDPGVAYGLIQKEQVGPGDLQFVFGLQWLSGLIVSILLIALSDPISSLLGENQASGPLRWLAVTCLLNALAAPSVNLLRRSMNFKWLSAGHLFSVVLGYVLFAIPSALSGFGIWSLVGASVVQSTVYFMWVTLQVRPAMRPTLSHPNSSPMLSYGLVVFATNWINWAILSFDKFIISRAFGPREMGLYTASYNITYNVVSSISSVLQPVFFSALPHLKNDIQRMRDSYLALLGGMLIIVATPLVAGAACAGIVVEALYGPKWHGMEDLLQPVLLSFASWALLSISTPILWQGKSRWTEFSSQCPVLVVYMLAIPTAAGFGVEAVAWTITVLNLLRASVVVSLCMRALEVEMDELWTNVRAPLLLVSGIPTVAFGLQATLAKQQWAPVAELSLIAVASAAVLIFGVYWLKKFLPEPLVALVEKIERTFMIKPSN